MNWDAIGAIGQMLGSITVLVTLIYLAAQIRQNTTSVRAATFQNIVGMATTFAHDLAKDPELRRVMNLGLSAQPMSESDERVFHLLMISFLRRYENMHYQSRMGLLNDGQWQGLRESLLRILRRPGFRSWWQDNAATMNADFREFVDDHLVLPNAEGAGSR